MKTTLDDRTQEVDWERDYARVDFTRRFSISEERANPNATEATKNATVFFRNTEILIGIIFHKENYLKLNS